MPCRTGHTSGRKRHAHIVVNLLQFADGNLEPSDLPADELVTVLHSHLEAVHAVRRIRGNRARHRAIRIQRQAFRQLAVAQLVDNAVKQVRCSRQFVRIHIVAGHVAAEIVASRRVVRVSGHMVHHVAPRHNVEDILRCFA